MDTEQVILEVGTHRNLWDPSHEDYKNREARQNSWYRIAENVIANFDFLNVEEKRIQIDKVQQRWKSARDTYTRMRATAAGRRTGGKRVSRYIYSNQIQFLNTLHEPRSESPNSDMEEICVDQSLVQCQLDASDPEDIQMNAAEPMQMQMMVEDTCDSPWAHKKAKVNHQYSKDGGPGCTSAATAATSFEESLIALLEENKERQEDEDRSFLMSLLPTLRQFDTDQKLLFRSIVLNTMIDIKNSHNTAVSKNHRRSNHKNNNR